MTGLTLREIARALGRSLPTGNGYVCCCPLPSHGKGRGDRNPSLSIAIGGNDDLLVKCHAGRDPRDVLAELRRCGLIEARQRPSTGGEVNIAADLAKGTSGLSGRDLASAARIVAEICPLISAPIALAYLDRVRKINVAAIEDVLSQVDAIGWHPAVYFNEPGHPLHRSKLGAIVAVMSDAMTAEPTGAISRTYLAPDGTKVGKAKTLGSPAGIVRLSPDDEVLAGLFLAEGIETALNALSIGLRPVWSTGSRVLIAKIPLLGGIEALNVIVDHDRNGAGEKAAREVEARWLGASREVNFFCRTSLAILTTA